MEEEKREVIDGQLMASVASSEMVDNTDDIIAAAERRISNLQKVITLALRITNITDWVDFSGKPFLGSSGCQKVARLFGVCWREMKTEKNISSDEKGQFYFYKTTSLFYLKGKNDLIEATGTCSSKDQFFAKSGGEMRPMSEIDETNILKSSVTNCISNGITSLLGLKNLTWEQIKAGGIDTTKTAKVNYASGGAGGGKISEAQRKRLFAIMKTAGGTEEKLKTYLKDNFKVEHTADIMRGDYEAVCEWASNTENYIDIGM